MTEWSLVYDTYNPASEKMRESLCALGNGYFVTRGAAPDARAGGHRYPGTYLAGGYNRLVSRVKGREIENEDLVNLPNWLSLSFQIDADEWFRIDTVELLSYRQELKLREGLLCRDLRFRDHKGRTSRWRERRFVSMQNPHTAGLEVEILAEDWSGRLTLRSGIDGAVRNEGVARYRDLNNQHLDVLSTERLGENTVMLCSRTNQSGIEIAQAMRTRAIRNGTEVDAERRTESSNDCIGEQITLELNEGDAITAEKMIAFYTSRDAAISAPALEARERITQLGSFDHHLRGHRMVWRGIWEDCDIHAETRNSADVSLKLRLHIFHLMQTISRHTVEMDAGTPARGWHGEAYRGHVFWDEIFILPFFNVRMPSLTLALLKYRYRRLDAARQAAKDAGFEGAMFPWQSASSGREESQKWHLNPESGHWIPDNTHLQRHVSCAIAYCIWQYYQAAPSQEFIISYAAELMVEIARFWASLATYDEQADRFDIRGVMGPDEYHTMYPDADPHAAGGIDNNAYTNVMVAWLLGRTGDIIDLLPDARRRQICDCLGVTAQDIRSWDRISRRLRIPIDDDGIIIQFEGYDDLIEFPWQQYRDKYPDIQRLDRILEKEADTPNRYQVSKQADVLMLFYLFSEDVLESLFERLGYPFRPEYIPKNIHYYLERTSHGSTLSRVVHSWVLARSDRTRSWQLFLDALNSDISDIQDGTTAEGIHLGAMAGTVDLLHRCYTGLEVRGDVLHLNPALPEDLLRLKFCLRYRQHRLRLDITQTSLSIHSEEQKAYPIKIAYRDEQRDIAPGESVQFRLGLHGST